MLLIEDKFENLPRDHSAVRNDVRSRVNRSPITHRKRISLNGLYRPPDIDDHEAMTHESLDLGFCEEVLKNAPTRRKRDI